MSVPIHRLAPGRVLSVDTFRGLTFLVMLFVNFIAGAAGIPPGIHHVAADVDGMHLADIVFPAFLFTVGMSIPFATNARLVKGDSVRAVLTHTGWRGVSLIVLGVFMVNMESGHDAAAMPMPIAAWGLCFYAAVALVWGSYRLKQPLAEMLLRRLGMAILLVLALTYRSTDGGGMSVQWWGILGLIGWAYLGASAVYLAARGRQIFLALGIGICVALFAASSAAGFLPMVAPHATHTAIALAGILCSVIFFDTASSASPSRRLAHGMLLTALLAAGAAVLHMFFPISKIGATPSWALYCAAICCALFTLLYWIVDIRAARSWTVLVEPAASSPLVTYLLPFVLGASMELLRLQWLPSLMHGYRAMLLALVFSFATIGVVALLNRINFKLKL